MIFCEDPFCYGGADQDLELTIINQWGELVEGQSFETFQVGDTEFEEGMQAKRLFASVQWALPARRILLQHLICQLPPGLSSCRDNDGAIWIQAITEL